MSQDPHPTPHVFGAAAPLPTAEPHLMSLMTFGTLPPDVATTVLTAVKEQAAANNGNWLLALQSVLASIAPLLGPASPYVGAASAFLSALIGLFHLGGAPAPAKPA